jgi:subfamily B ATP-binding cassette protein MsbA
MLTKQTGTKNKKMQKLKDFIKKYFKGFTFFYRILKYRIFIALSVSVFVGILDGFGLAMFLPLLQLVGGDKEATGEGMGKLDFMVEALQNMGLSLTLQIILVTLIIFFVIKGILTYGGNVYNVHIRQYFLRNLRLSLLRNFNRIKFKSYIQWDIGRIQNAFTTETERIANSFTHYFKTLNQGVNVAVYAGFAFTVDPKFATLVIIGGGLTHFVYSYFYKLSRKASRSLSSGNSIFHGLVIQHINNFKYLKATGRHLFYGKKLEEIVLDIEEQNKKLGVYGAALSSIREPLMIIIVALVIYIQTQVLDEPLAPILISLLFFYRALSSLNAMQSTWNLFIKFSGSIENVESFSNELKQNKEAKNGKLNFESDFKDITFKMVSFAYGEKKVIDNINLSIRKNESIAFVGESGSGKTTLVNIISGLLKPTQGSYLIDGKELKDININQFQKRVGFIAQEPVIFSTSIFNNITFFAKKTEQTKARFWQAINDSALEDFMTNLNNNEDEDLGSNGVNISGGQRQRIAIARELYRDIDILILDEATAALDGETERIIQDSIDQLKGKYTIITVAHRLATIKNADRVVLMDQGEIVNALPFDQLVEAEPRFAKMAEIQSI